jgi:hypothetical protein
LVDLHFGQSRKEKTQVGVRKVSVSKFHEDVKVPVGEWTVSQSIKDSKDKPGCGGQQEANEIQTPCFLPNPSEQVEDNEAGMKDGEEDVKKFHPSLFSP